jgi:hypothetical protein
MPLGCDLRHAAPAIQRIAAQLQHVPVLGRGGRCALRIRSADQLCIFVAAIINTQGHQLILLLPVRLLPQCSNVGSLQASIRAFS